MLATSEILHIQALAREEMQEMLEIMEMRLTASTNLLPPLLKWLQCSPRSMGCLSHLRNQAPQNNQVLRFREYTPTTACPKDSFPLPRIDQLVDATAGQELLRFMDAYSGYNQIRMHQPDQEHTAFITDQGLYCYKVMPFGLKNAGIPRNENTNADTLARLATGLEDSLLKMIPLEILDEPSINKRQQGDAISEKPTWMDPIMAYLRDGTLPPDKFEARRLRYRSARYYLDKDKLHKRSFSSPSLTCLNEDQAKYVLQEVHEGVCGNHSGGRALAHKVLRQGYYWPTIQADSLAFVQKCDKCQSRGQLKYAVVAIDYYTKWVEAEALAKITEQNVTNFIWKHIICRFRIPRELVSDHDTQFENEKLRSICRNLGITKIFSSPAHPKSNGQVEAVNKTIKYTLKKKLEKSKGAWVDELPLVLWSYKTSFRTTTGESPFSLTYGVDVVVPVELGIPTFRIKNFNEEDNDVLLALASDLLEEKREKAQLRATALQQIVARHYNSKVRLRRFTKGDLVIRRIFFNTKEKGVGVLGPNWEGPYRVLRAILRSGTYELETLGGKVLANPWNAEHLKKYYQ
ncbi:hypothetical protein UlMin_035114 [Ulmus minor]